MGLNEYLMAIVSSMVSWTVVNENMGLLNVLFVPNSDTNATKFKINLNFADLKAFLFAVFKQESVSLAILETLPNGIGGPEAVKIAQANPNRESFILWICFSIFLVAQVFIILILTINCCCCFGQEDKDVITLQKLMSSTSFNIKPIKRYDSVLKSIQMKFKNIFKAINGGIKTCEDEGMHIKQMIQTSLNISSMQTVSHKLLLVSKIKLNEQVDALEYYLEPVKSYIFQYAQPLSISFYGIGGLLIVMLIIASLVIARLLYRAFRDQLYVDPDDLCVETEINTYDKLACGKKFTCCFSTYLMVVLPIFATVIGLLLFLLTVAAGEGCIYFTRETAIQKTDHVLNTIMADKWREINPQWRGYFNMKPPRNVLKALKTACKYDSRKETVGLFYSLGYDNIFDINGIVQSKYLQNGLKEGKSALLRRIDNEYIPSPPSSEMSFSILKTYFSSRTSSTSLEDVTTTVRNNFLKVATLETLYKKLLNFSQTHPNFTERTPNFSLLLSNIGRQRELANKIQANIVILKDETRFNSSLFKFIASIQQAIATLTSKPTLMNELTKQSNKLMDFITEFVKKEGNSTLRHLTKLLMPCFKAHEAYSTAVGTFCGETGIIYRLIGGIYILALSGNLDSLGHPRHASEAGRSQALMSFHPPIDYTIYEGVSNCVCLTYELALASWAYASFLRPAEGDCWLAIFSKVSPVNQPSPLLVRLYIRKSCFIRATTMSTLNQQRKVVEQLRLEAGIHRRPVSECIRDMIGFIEQYRDKDCLVNGFASKKDNPFQEKGGCQLL
nr:G protein gamma subunit [Hymenolepis microstoma]